MGSSTKANIRFIPFCLDRKDFREKVIMPVSEFWVTFAPYTESDGTVWQVYAVDPSKGFGRTSV